jgi:PIN domain nuclease of toxin-antitoxin system
VDEVAAGAERIIRNPVDRMLIAQAIREPMVLLTRDATLPEYGSLITVM